MVEESQRLTRDEVLTRIWWLTYAVETQSGNSWALDEIRKVHIQRVLEMCQGNRLRAAQILGIGRTSLYRYLKRDAAPAIATPQKQQARSGGAAA